jgi:hypothetical protein
MSSELFPDLQKLKKQLTENLKDLSTSLRGTADEAISGINKFIEQIDAKDRRIQELENKLLARDTVQLHGTAHVVWGNMDLTEGRGPEFPMFICQSLTTAIRMGQKRGVQGSDCHVSEMPLLRYAGWFYGPVRVQPMTDEDGKNEKALDARKKAMDKARAAGLTDEDLKALRHA